MDSLSGIFWVCFLAYGMIQGTLLAILFPVMFKGDKAARWLLAFISATCAFLLLEEILVRFKGYEKWPHLIFAFSPLWYLLPALLYLYMRFLLQDRRVSWKDGWHIIPMILMILTTWHFFRYPGEVKLQYLSMIEQGEVHLVHNFNFWLFTIQVTGYFSWTVYMIIVEGYKRIDQNTFIWICQLMIVLGALAVLGLLTVGGFNWISTDLWFLDILFPMTISIFLLFLFIEILQSKQTVALVKKAYKASWEISAEFEVIQNYMLCERPFINHQFDLQQLAWALNMSKNRISTAIKRSTGKSFKSYLDDIRIEDAKAKLDSPMSKQFTIQYIAEDSGFNSLATFYRVFKKTQGITPKAFINRSGS